MATVRIYYSRADNNQSDYDLYWFGDNPEKIEEQVKNTQLILNEFKTNNSPSQLAAESLNKFI